MSWGSELWDQFDNVAAHTQRGIDFLEKCGQFMKERCTIELEYATKLRRLVKNYNPKKKDDEEQFTYWKAFVGMLNEINDLAGQHEIIAENLNTAVIADLTTCIKDIKDERKRHLQEGSKVQSNLQACFVSLDKAKKNYEKSSKEAEKMQENFVKADADLNLSRVEVEKARNLKVLKVQQCDDSKNEYANHLQKYNDLQYQHYNDLMPSIFTQLQEMDERRILEFKKLIALSADIERKVFPIINQCIDGITKSALSIDPKEDSKLVIERYKSGFQSPADIPFEDFSSMKSGSTGSGSSNESNGPVHHATVRSESSMLLGTLTGGKIKKRTGIFGFFSANKPNSPEIKDDYSDLPPNQRKKKLQNKLDGINAQIQQETATRDGLMKMKVVYEQNSALGDPQSIEGQLIKTGYKLDNLRQEMHKYQTYMADATNSMTPNTQKKHNRNSISDDSLSRSASDSSMTNPINNNSNSRSSQKVSTLPTNTSNVSIRSKASTVRVEAPTAEPEYLNDGDEEEEEANGGDFDEADTLPILGTCKALYGFDGQSEGSIPMRDGEMFQVVELDQGDGWTRVRRDNHEEGFVPTSYIECYLYTDV